MAFPMDLKVVKVGDINSPLEEQSYLLYDPATSESDEEFPEKGGAPQNWPKILQLSRPRSCESCQERTNCVNKAIEHLQLLLDILTDWIEKTKENVPEYTDANPDKGKLFPLTTDLVPSRSVGALKDYNCHVHLKAVVGEVMLLLSWLHNDCLKTEAKLFSVIDCNTRISLEMDGFQRQKLIDLKEAVQMEHDLPNKACFFIWKKVMALEKSRATTQRKLKSNQFLNLYLKRDIAIGHKKIPLMQYKMAEQKQKIDEIQNILVEAEEKMYEIQKNQPKTEFKFTETLRIARQEENLIQQQINEMSREFNILHDAAKLAKWNFHDMNKLIANGKQRIEDTERNIVELRVKLENRRTESYTMKIKAEGEKKKLIQKMKVKIMKTSENEKLEDVIQKMKNEYNSKIMGLEADRLKLEMEMKSLLDTNYTKSDLIEYMKMKVDSSKKQKGFYDHSIKRMEDEIKKLENQIEFIVIELKKIQNENKMICNAIERAECQRRQDEESLSKKIVQMGKLIAAENKSFLELTSSVGNLEFHMRSRKCDAEKEKDEIQTKINDVNEHLEKLKDKKKRLMILKHQKEQALANLNAEKERLKDNHKQALQDNDIYLENLRPYRKSSIDKCEKLERRIKDMLQEREKIEMEIELLLEQCKILEETLKKYQEEIEKNNDILEELNVKIEIAAKLYADTETRWDQARERFDQEHQEHAELMHCRKETLEEVLQKKERDLKLNEQLAPKYRTIQINLVQRKMEFVQLSENTIRLKRALKDLKQVMKVQLKMHHNNTKLFQKRGLWHGIQLAYFVNISDGRLDKFKQLKFEFSSKVNTITTNLDEIKSSFIKNSQCLLPKMTQDALPKITQQTT